MRPRWVGTASRSTSGFGFVPMVQMTVAPGMVSPLSSSTPSASIRAARDFNRTSMLRDAHGTRGGQAERRRQFEQQAIAVLDHRDLQFMRLDPRVIARRAAQEVGEFAGYLDARKPATDDDEVAQPFARHRIGLEFDASDRVATRDCG